MSTRSFLCLLVCLPLAAVAQQASPLPSVSSSPVAAPEGSPASAASTPAAHMAMSGGGISPEERTKLLAAREKALQDPAVQAATVKVKQAQEGVRSAMVADDKTLGPILDKLQSGGGAPGSRTPLTDDEKRKFIAERQKLQDSPQAKSMMEAATAYRVAMRQALITADPTLSPLLDRIDAASRAAAGVPAASKP